jgi:hypothetical protein
MDDTQIIATFVVIDDLMKHFGHQDHVLAQASDAEVLTVAVLAAKYFQNHHERTLQVVRLMGLLSGALSISRFNRRLHRLADWLPLLVDVLGRLFENQEVLIIDSLPLPVCHRVRAWRCRKVRGRDYCGYCAAKKQKFFGWRMHIVCTPAGVPVRFSMLPASYHDLTPIHELLWELPAGTWVIGDKGYISAADAASILAETGVHLIAKAKDNMTPNSYEERQALEQHRHAIETMNSQLERMGFERLYARTNQGFELKALASLLALTLTNIN